MKESDTAGGCVPHSLEAMYRAGVDFFVDGEEVSLQEAMRRTVQEEHAYMADYVLDCTGKVRQVRFDKVELS